MKSFTFASNQERDRYLSEHFKDRRDTLTPYAFDVPGGTISVFEKTIVFEPAEGQGGEASSSSRAGGLHEETRPVQATAISPPAAGTAGVFALLRHDHQRVMALVMKVRTGLAMSDHATAARLFEALKDEIHLHATIEDLHIYRIFQQAEVTRDAARRALAAHAHIQELLDQAADRGGGDWPSTLPRLSEALQRHIEEEERDLFGRVGELMTKEEAEELAATVTAARRQAVGKEAQPAGGIPRG